MSTLLFEHLSGAYHALRRNRMRTLLTVLGIAIGIASVTCILSISGGVMKMVGGQVEALDGKLAVVRPGIQTRDPNAFVNPIAQQSFSTSTLTENDVASLAKIPGVEAAVPLMTIDGTIKAGTKSVSDNVVLATTAQFANVSSLKMKSGQFLDEVTDVNTAVIGEDLAVELYDTDRPLGQVFSIRGTEFTIIGVIKRAENPINFNNVDLNHAVVVSFERGQLFHQGRSQIQQINLLTDKSANLESVTKAASSTLVTNHLGEKDFTITSGEEITKPTNQLLKAVTDVMTAVAAISLFVGGIGIMNIMLVGVAERTREIGIRKAVGASNGSIVMQFMIESLILSLLGGIIGFGFGLLGAFVVSLFMYFTPAVSWQIAVVALAMAVAAGTIFGIYPAFKAARKNTIESLRQYH